MSKINLFLLFGFITIFVSLKRWEDNAKVIVKLLTKLLEGMSEKGECSFRWEKNKDRIEGILRDILNKTQTIKENLEREENITITLDKFLNREEFEDIIRANAIKFVTIKRLAQKCRLLDAVPIFIKLNEKNFNETFYNYFFNNTENTKELYNTLVKAKDNKSRYMLYGEIFSKYFNFTVK